MKKILFTLTLLMLSAAVSFAQSTTPRTQKTTVKVSTADAAGADTVKLVPNAYETIVCPSANIADSLVYVIKRVTNCQLGDKLVFLFTNEAASGNYIRLSGTTFMSAIPADTTLSLTSGKRTRVSFTFDGAKFQQDAVAVENQ